LNNAIAQLLELQQMDNKCDDLRARIADIRAQKLQISVRIERERDAVEILVRELEELRHKSRMMNLQVDEIDMQIREYQHRLDVGIISFKEMESLRIKIESERKHMNQMEDEALLLMDSIEEMTSMLSREKETLARRESELIAESAKLDERIATLEDEIADHKRKRDELLTSIPAHAVKRYDILRKKVDSPVVTVENGSCSGCKLTISGTTIERARDGMEIVMCENCSRILYVR
jgi:uncharacterized protein